MDNSWIKNSELLYDINKNIYKSFQDSIKIFFIYVNQKHFIEKTSCNDFKITNNLISKDKILKIILDNKIVTHDYVYNFDFVNLFSVPFEHDKINEFNNSKSNYDNSVFFSKLSINNDISIPKTLFIFHPYNSLYIFYRQTMIEKVPKSILLTPFKKQIRKKTKKKVQILDNNFRKTKKSI